MPTYFLSIHAPFQQKTPGIGWNVDAAKLEFKKDKKKCCKNYKKEKRCKKCPMNS